MANVMERFNEKWTPEPYSNCWLWTAATSGDGYGRFSFNGKCEKASRIAWFLYRGNPESNDVCHHCDTPACVNPDHLFLGQAVDNIRDAVKKGRIQRGSTHYNSKLTDDQVTSIKNDQRKQKEIAKEYGVSAWQVCAIKNNRRWGWLVRQK